MNRREFLKATGAAGVLASLNVLTAEASPIRTGYIPEDKGVTPSDLARLKQRGERRVFRGAQRFALGMPCGGIAAGQLYLLGDGTLGGWRVDGRLNNTGYGDTSYKIRQYPRELIQGFTLLVKNTDETAASWRSAALADVRNGGDYEGIEFIGEYPLAEVRYGKPLDTSFPIETTLRAGSPFIPLNAKDSALPCTLFRYTLKNTSDRRVKGRLVGYLQNGVDMTQPGEAPSLKRNQRQERGGMSLVLMSAQPMPDVHHPRPDRTLFDFDGPHYEGWEVRGAAFGLGPAKGAFKGQQEVKGFEGAGLVNSFSGDDDAMGEMISEPFVIDRRYLTFLIGGGAHAGATCANLLIDNQVVRSAVGQNVETLTPHTWDVGAFEGREARFQIVDSQKGGWAHINVDSVRLVDQTPASAKRPLPDSLTFGTMALAGVGHAQVDLGDLASLAKLDFDAASRPTETTHDSEAPFVGGVATPFELAPGESTELFFALTWHYPNLHTNNGVMYSNWFKDAADVVAYVASQRERLIRDTDLFRKTWYDDTSLPWWLTTRLFMPIANLATGTAQWWKNGRFWCWEGVGCCSGTCTHVWNYAHGEARLFPELARSTRVMQDLGTAFEETTGRVAFRGDVARGFRYAADGQSGTVLKLYREHLCSPDDAFLKTNWPRIQKTLEYQIERDAMSRMGPNHEPNGMIEVTQHNTFDINFEGPNTFVGSLYHAALLAGARMAELMNDTASAARYREIARRGREFTEARLYKNGYFVQLIPDDAGTKYQYGSGCLTDQLFGQNWARCLGLGTLYDEEKVRGGLRSIYRHNYSPAVGQYNADFPPERVFAEGRDAGLFICTWPTGGRPKTPVLYRDEVWTGCEYQAAGGMIWEGLLDEALVILNAVDQRYDGAARNPWNEVECGDHYGRSLASYGVFQALCGFTLDGPAGVIGMAPKLSPENFAAFFTGPEGWGLATQTRASGKQTNRFETRWGALRISTVTTELPADLTATRATVTCGGKTIDAKLERDGVSASARLSQPVQINAGETIEVVFSA